MNDPARERDIRRGAGLRATQVTAMAVTLVLLNACGESMFENAGDRNNFLEGRKVCAAEIAKSPAGEAYRQNPTAHPDYISQMFEGMNRCIEGKGWNQVRSPQEQELLKEAVTSELTDVHTPTSITKPAQPTNSTLEGLAWSSLDAD